MMAPKTPVTMKRKGQGSELSGSSDDKEGFIPEALYIGRCSLPTIFFLLHFPEHQVLQKCMMGGETGDTPARQAVAKAGL